MNHQKHFEILHGVKDSDEKNKMILFEMIFSKCHILCSVISKQLKTAQLSFYMQMLYFMILNHFQQIKY